MSDKARAGETAQIFVPRLNGNNANSKQTTPRNSKLATSRSSKLATPIDPKQTTFISENTTPILRMPIQPKQNHNGRSPRSMSAARHGQAQSISQIPMPPAISQIPMPPEQDYDGRSPRSMSTAQYGQAQVQEARRIFTNQNSKMLNTCNAVELRKAREKIAQLDEEIRQFVQLDAQRNEEIAQKDEEIRRLVQLDAHRNKQFAQLHKQNRQFQERFAQLDTQRNEEIEQLQKQIAQFAQLDEQKNEEIAQKDEQIRRLQEQLEQREKLVNKTINTLGRETKCSEAIQYSKGRVEDMVAIMQNLAVLASKKIKENRRLIAENSTLMSLLGEQGITGQQQLLGHFGN